MKSATKKFVLTAKGEVNKTVKFALANCGYDKSNNKIYPIHYSGSGRYISKRDYTFYVTNILRLQGYKFETGNDAKRGGQNGNYFKVSTAAFKFILNLQK